MEAVTFKVRDFEGPLDLLLHLVSKNKMSIYDIDLMKLVEQYLQFISSNDMQQLEIASEFIEMAARLVYIKSVFLLPKSDDANDLKAELTGLLIEYALAKQIALKLRDLAEGVVYFVRAPIELTLDPTYKITHSIYELEHAFNNTQGRHFRRAPVNAQEFDELVTVPFVSVSSRIINILKNLVSGRMKKLNDFFAKDAGKSHTVATFLAILELMKAGRVTINNASNLTLKK